MPGQSAVAPTAPFDLKHALILLEPIKAQFPDVGYADLYQLASATAVEVSVPTF